MKRYITAILLLLCSVVIAEAQITGEVTDESGEPIPYASVIYKGHHIATASNAEGQFSIARHEGWTLTVSSVGFKPQTFVVNDGLKSPLKVKLKEDATALGEVVIKSKRGRYSRKNNPAVELMRRVIAAKKKTDLENHDYYQYNKYQKITLALNNVNLGDVDSLKGKKKWYLNQIETSPYNNKLILPVSVDETVTQRIFRKDPRDQKDIILGQQSQGVNQLLSTGDMMNTMLKEVFQDVDIYDDRVRLLQYPFTSPIGETAIAFYRSAIISTSSPTTNRTLASAATSTCWPTAHCTSSAASSPFRIRATSTSLSRCISRRSSPDSTTANGCSLSTTCGRSSR